MILFELFTINMSKEIEQNLEKIFINALEIKKKDFNNVKKLSKIDFDSLRYMTLLSLIEKKFKIRIKKKDIFAFTSFSKTLKIIKNYKK